MELTKTVAIYKCVSNNYNSLSECDPWMEKDNDYIKVTNSLDITLIPIEESIVVNATISSLQKKKENIRADTQSTINNLDERIQELLALPSLNNKENTDE